jgi:O-antigen/teichoic acid export membrane protein
MTSDSTKKLKKDITTGLFWNVIEKLSLHGLKLLVSVLLARILEPSQFGIIGMLSLLMAISQSVLDSGFGSALIQKKNATHTDYCSIFYFNLIMGSILTGLLWLSAPYVASFFDQPKLLNLTRFMSLNIFLNGFGLVQSSILSKEMRFKNLFKINFLSAATSGIIAIIFAYRGLGVWSIALQSVLSTLFINLLLWLFNSWRPSFIFSFESVKSMFPFGSSLLATDIFTKAITNLYQTIIGKFYTAADVGYYSNASSMINALLNITNGSFSNVMFPSFSPLQDEEEKLRKGYRKAVRYACFLHFPLMIGLWAIVDHLIPFLLTERWNGSIPILKLLCLANFLYPLDLINLNILKVKGRMDLYFKISTFEKVFALLALFLTVRHGIVAMLYGQIASSISALFINGYYSSKMISYSTFAQIKDVSPSVFASFMMGLGMFLVSYLPLGNPIFYMLLQGIVGIIVYFAVCLFLDSGLVYEIRDLATTFIKNSFLSKRGKSKKPA